MEYLKKRLAATVRVKVFSLHTTVEYDMWSNDLFSPHIFFIWVAKNRTICKASIIYHQRCLHRNWINISTTEWNFQLTKKEIGVCITFSFISVVDCKDWVPNKEEIFMFCNIFRQRLNLDLNYFLFRKVSSLIKD